jgi:hypothetical protein
MRRVTLMTCLAGALMGCPSPTGRVCDSDPCPTGYSCTRFLGETVTRCLPSCDRRSDCPQPALCEHLVGACDELRGTRQVGESCEYDRESNRLDTCAPGLRCDIQSETCLPGCSARSDHSDDRFCGGGAFCDPRNSGADVCRETCDPSLPNPCTNGVCVRFTSPTGDFAFCEADLLAQSCENNMMGCPENQVCVDNVCYRSEVAPARSWQSPEIPPPID